MGLGDAKLLSAIGFWFGWFSIPIVIFFSSIIALSSVIPSLINKTRKFIRAQFLWTFFYYRLCNIYFFWKSN